jgi:hypothetical protein
MTSPQPAGTHQASDAVDARCACGLAFPGPWQLVSHLLATYPPHADQPLDDTPHGDATSLTAKLAEGPTEAWDATTWARSTRKHLRVAASIAHRSATAGLQPFQQLTQHDVHHEYQVTVYVARKAIAQLKAIDVLHQYGIYTNVNARYLVDRTNAAHRAQRALHLIATHVTSLEAKLSTLEAQEPPAHSQEQARQPQSRGS